MIQFPARVVNLILPMCKVLMAEVVLGQSQDVLKVGM